MLRRYLDAWLPIMGLHAGRILFIDGFAGPGEYEGGEDGSPVIAVKAFLEHRAKSKIKAEVKFLFIEENADRAAHLEELMRQFRPQLPAGSSIEIHIGKFQDLAEVLVSLEEAQQALAPAFVMVDPFGVSETPMSLLAKILQNPKSEVYVSFMYESINRFITTPEFEGPLDSLYGTNRWREARAIVDADQRKEFLYNLYTEQLRMAGARHVIRFELFEGNRLVYAIFFATKHHLGCGKMKDAIWKIAPFGDFAFRGHRHGQTLLDLEQVDLRQLQEELQTAFAGQEWVTVDQLEEWIQSDATDYCSKHLRPALRSLESAGKILVDPTSRKRAGFHPKGTKLRFV